MRFLQQFRALIRPSDYDRSVAFYRETLGLDIFNSWDDPHGKGTVFQLGSGLIEIELGQGTSGPPGFKGVVIQVEDAIAAHRELVSRGAVATEPFLAPWGHRFFHVQDLDGVRLVFFEQVG